jgi:uncharacterized protein YbjT (DUF2867 family)
MIIITGANGRLGSRIVDRLLERVPSDQIGVSVRDVDAAAPLAARGVRVRAGDFTDPTGLARAFEDADQVLVVSAGIMDNRTAIAANRAAIDAAAHAGADRIFYTSHQAASAQSLFAPQLVHAATEQYLLELREHTGIPFTALRDGFYASTLVPYAEAALVSGELALPEDGPVSWTSHDDLADAAVAALLEPGRIDGISAPLTAGATLDFDAVARELSERAGREIRRIVLDDDEWVEQAVGRGMPRAVAEFGLGMFRAARRGEFDVVDPTLGKMIGRDPIPAHAVLEPLFALQA